MSLNHQYTQLVLGKPWVLFFLLVLTLKGESSEPQPRWIRGSRASWLQGLYRIGCNGTTWHVYNYIWCHQCQSQTDNSHLEASTGHCPGHLVKLHLNESDTVPRHHLQHCNHHDLPASTGSYPILIPLRSLWCWLLTPSLCVQRWSARGPGGRLMVLDPVVAPLHL